MTKQYNVNIVGNLTNDNGILSGFSINDYATLPETLEGLTINNLEIVFKFKTNSLTSNNAIFWTDKLIEVPSIPWAGLRLCNYNPDNFVFDLEITNNGTQIADIYDATAILPNTYYYIKALYNNTDGYSLYKSEDGESYTLVGTAATTVMPINRQAIIGRAVDIDPIPLDGSIDLNESYIKVNGVIWWKGAENITKIQLRHDTAANWTSVNPILLDGEVGIETDTRKQKFGDGVTAWNSLSYDAGSTALQSITSSNVTNALGYVPVSESTLNDYLQYRADLTLSNITSMGTLITSEFDQVYDELATKISGITSSDVTTALGYTPVNKAGDTMTGGLIISANSPYQGLRMNDTGQVAGTTPSSEKNIGLRFYDNNGTYVGYIQNTYSTDGSRKLLLNCRNGAGNKSGTMMIGFNGSDNFISEIPSCQDNSSIVTTISKSKAQNGYYKLGNGLIIQWGTNSVAYGSNTINLPTAFTSTNYIALAIPANITNGYGVTGRATTSFTFNATASTTIDWIAIGY